MLAQLLPHEFGAGPLRQGEHLQQVTAANVEFVSPALNGQLELAVVGIQHRYEFRRPASLPADEQFDFARAGFGGTLAGDQCHRAAPAHPKTDAASSLCPTA